MQFLCILFVCVACSLTNQGFKDQNPNVWFWYFLYYSIFWYYLIFLYDFFIRSKMWKFILLLIFFCTCSTTLRAQSSAKYSWIVSSWEVRHLFIAFVRILLAHELIRDLDKVSLNVFSNVFPLEAKSVSLS